MSHAHPPQTLGIVTTTRADYGLYRPLLRALGAAGYGLRRFVGGTHLRDDFGRTGDWLTADSTLGEIRCVDYLSSRDDARGVSDSAGAALAELGRAFAAAPVDLLFLLGDRYEMLAAATAAVLHRIPIAHLHGGDRTAGAYDDALRNAVSQLATLHFPALPHHAQRLQAMGIAPERICVTGALALDELSHFAPDSPDALRATLQIDFRTPTLVVSLHPETLEPRPAEQCFEVVAQAIAPWTGEILLVGPNADEGHLGLRQAMQRFAAARRQTSLVSALTQRQFWSCLAHAAALVGNSSAGIIESASLGVPVVNVGSRQAGRLHAANVIDVPWEASAVHAALLRATAPDFRASCRTLSNPWGDGQAATRIVAVLAQCLPPLRPAAGVETANEKGPVHACEQALVN
ncbi:MAG: UDP-N-acetylglucosamine 2-epimerase [Phycisphaerae bacterium]